MKWLHQVMRWKNHRRPRKALFLHIQKTAGSSIVQLAKSRYPDSYISHGDFGVYQPKDLVDVQFVSGHFGFGYASYLMDSRYSFTFLRDPAERILSYYYYNRGRDKNEYPMTRISHELDLEQFLEAGLVDPLVKSRIWNNQTWQLALGLTLGREQIGDFEPAELLDMATENLGKFSYVGLTETFDDDMDVILPHLGFEIDQACLHINKTDNRATISEISESSRDLLAQLTELDYKLYERGQIVRKALRAKVVNRLL